MVNVMLLFVNVETRVYMAIYYISVFDSEI